MFKGKFITFYGINNIGKSTHAKILCKRLRDEGYDVVYLKYPIYDIEPSGPYINKVLRGHVEEINSDELQLWFAVNRHQFESKLKKMLAEGKTVVAEDYVGTGIAWGLTKGSDGDWLESINSKLLESDFSILIDGERATNAIEKGHIHETKNDLIQKSREVHLHLAKKYGWETVPLQEKFEDTAKLVWIAAQKIT
jgi:thymidylate kinase